MTKTEKLLQIRQGHWYQFSDQELDHTFGCISTLKNVDWATDLAKKTELSIRNMTWLRENQDKVDQPEWLDKWSQLENLRTSLFEVRYAFDLHKRCVVPQYEAKTVGTSSVDFAVKDGMSTFLIELVSTTQTESMTNKTEHLTDNMRIVGTDPAEELRKVQSKIVRKVARKVDGGAEDEYKPHKFPPPVAGSGVYNVIIADTRGFNGGDHIEKYERIQLVWGAEEYLARGGSEIDVYWSNGQPMAGLFDSQKPGEEARLFRERIHLLGLVSEETFGEGDVIRQTRLYANPFLPDSSSAMERFPFNGKI